MKTLENRTKRRKSVSMPPRTAPKRILHKAERDMLSEEAQKTVYRCFSTEEIPTDVMEKAIQQAMNMGNERGSRVSEAFFLELVDAIMDDPFYSAPVYPMGTQAFIRRWLC
jgi:hypothetical protein